MQTHIVDRRSIIALLLLAVVLLAMHVLGTVRPVQNSLSAAAHIAFDDPWSGVNFSDFSTQQTNYVPDSSVSDQNVYYNYSAPSYNSGTSDFSVSDAYYGGNAPSSGLSDYNDSSWSNTPQTYTPTYYFDSSGLNPSDNYYGGFAPSTGLSADVYNESSWSWNDSQIYTPTASSDGWDYWYGSSESGNNTFVTTDSNYYNYTWPSFNSVSSAFYNNGTSTGVPGVYTDDSGLYKNLYNDPTGMGYYNVPGTEYYGTGWGTPTNTNYALNPSDYYTGNPSTNEYLDRCYGMSADGTPTRDANLLYCGRGPSPTELYATYGPNYIDYTSYATGGAGSCSLKDGNCDIETTTAPSIRRTQSGAIIDASVSSFGGTGGYMYGYSVTGTPRVQYYSAPTTYRTVQQSTASQVQYVPTTSVTQTSIPVSATPVLSAPTQLSCDVRIVHNGNFISVYYVTSTHTVGAYINGIGAVEPATGTTRVKNVYPPFANAYIMTIYGAQGQTANCTAVTPAYTPGSVQYTTGQSYTYQPTPQVYVSTTQNPPSVDYVTVGSLPYTGVESTAYFFIVLFAAAISIGALFMYQEVFVSEASGVLTGMLGMKRFRALGNRIEIATKHRSSLYDIPRDKK